MVVTIARDIFTRMVEKGARTVGDSIHKGADDGKESVSFIQSGARGGKEGEFRNFNRRK